MSGNKNFFQRALDTFIENRSREARRQMDEYMRDHQRQLKRDLTKQ